jgi:predicted DNA-binding transcriptional regulator YafY
MKKKTKNYNCYSGCSQTTFNVLEILAFLSKADEFCVNDVLDDLQLDRQAFMRHFKSIQHYFIKTQGKHIAEDSKRGCYRIINKEVFVQALDFGDQKELFSYIQVLQEVLPHYYNKLDPAIKKRLKKEKTAISSAYHFHNQRHEKNLDLELLEKIEKSVYGKRKVDIEYKTNKGIQKYQNARPLKIIYMEGNLYLGCLVKSDPKYGFDFYRLRVHLIKGYTLLSETYNETRLVKKALNFIQTFQSPFDDFGKEKRVVKLIVSKSIAKHFLQKKYLSSQTEEVLEDGRLRVTYWVTNEKEIFPLVKKWLPDIYIEEPTSWKEQLEGELFGYLYHSSFKE